MDSTTTTTPATAAAYGGIGPATTATSDAGASATGEWSNWTCLGERARTCTWASSARASRTTDADGGTTTGYTTWSTNAEPTDDPKCPPKLVLKKK